MNDDDIKNIKPPGDPGPAGNDDSPAGLFSRKMKCEEIRELLTDYVTRELGESRSLLVREHIRKCPECQATAREIAEAMDLLRLAGGGSTVVPQRLSDKRRKRIGRAYRHPLLGWIETHHVAVSMVIAAIVALLVIATLHYVQLFHEEDEYYPSVPIHWIPDVGKLDLDEVPPAGDPPPLK